jgi:hypothetical protein
MRYRNPVSSVTRAISGAIILLGLALAFTIGHGFFLPVFFVALAFSILIGSIGSLNPRGVLGGIQGFLWMLILALFFITNNWVWFLVGAAISAVLGALIRPISAWLLSMGIFSATSRANREQQPYYQPPQQQQPYQPYQEGYQPPQSQTYEEGGQAYQYPQQYEQPQAHYPQEMPPQQQ